MCEGTGDRGRWVSLPKFLKMLRAVQYKREHSVYKGGMHFYACDARDDIEEVCGDCCEWTYSVLCQINILGYTVG
jgi:hypothetical protein